MRDFLEFLLRELKKDIGEGKELDKSINTALLAAYQYGRDYSWHHDWDSHYEEETWQDPDVEAHKMLTEFVQEEQKKNLEKYKEYEKWLSKNNGDGEL